MRNGRHNSTIKGVKLTLNDKKKAGKLLFNGHLYELYSLIKPGIRSNDPEALYYYSCFSLPEWKETDLEFEKRAFSLRKEAAKSMVPEALYALGLAYLNGEGVKQDAHKSESYFKKEKEIREGIKRKEDKSR